MYFFLLTECFGQGEWTHTKSGDTIDGYTYEMIADVTSLTKCFDACDAEEYCVYTLHDRVNKKCYLYLPNYFGWQKFTVSGLERFERKCRQGNIFDVIYHLCLWRLTITGHGEAIKNIK